MNMWRLRKEWIERVSGLELQSGPSDQYLLTYEPGDSTHYEVSLSPAQFAPMSRRLGYPGLRYWQFSVWSGPSGIGNGTMLLAATHTGCLNVEGVGFIAAKLRCSDYTSGVLSILIHGCLVSYDLSVAQESIARFRAQGRLGFVDPDAA